MPTTLYKPRGLTVFPRHAEPDGDSLLQRLYHDAPHRRDHPWPDGFAGGIVHRLDRWTSGAVWVADDPAELGALRVLFREGQLEKTYRFLAASDVPWSTHVVDRPLAHDRRRKQRMVVQRGPNTPHRGRWYPAHTRFRRLHGHLWEAVITTGVMHQIRAHAGFVGLGLTGDRWYGRGADGFFLHHVGLQGSGHRTDPVPLPGWATLEGE